MGIRRRAAAGFGTALVLLGVLGASPQDDPRVELLRRRAGAELPVPLQDPDEDLPAGGPRNTALLRAYSDLDELTVRVPALVKGGNYAEALSIFEKALRDQPRTVVPLDAARARGLEGYVLDQIGSWPEEGRAVYRRAADPAARRLFEAARSAGDAAALEDLAERYPYSSVANDALSLAASLRFDAGSADAAVRNLELLLALEGDAPRPVTMARLGLACGRAGRRGRLEELAERAAREMAGATVKIGGEDRDLAGFLRGQAREAREAPPTPAALAMASWEMMGGHPSGSRLAGPAVEAPRLAWTWPLRPTPFGHEGLQFPMRGYVPVPSGEFRPFFPAVSDGVLYVHNETTAAALNLFSRRPQILWQYGVPDPGGEVMFEDRVIHATTVHEGRVYVNLMTAVDRPDDQLSYVRVKYPFPRRALFALDAASGRLLWKLGGVLRREALEENATFSAPPVPDGGRLYVGAVRQKLPTDPFEHYVLCLEASTGRILWRTFVASGLTEINLFGNSTRESLGTPVAVTEDAVFYGTNHGAVAALEKKEGKIRWVYRYAQLPVRPTRSIAVSKNRLGWINSPPVVAQGVVVATPLDAPAAYGLDVRTGELRWARPRSMEIRTAYGVRETTLVLGGDGLEFVDIRTGKLVAMTGPELRGTGRGAVAEDGVYVPSVDGLRRVGWDGAWENRPAGGWGGARPRGGNLTVVDGVLVLAAHDGIDVYVDRRGPEKGLLAEFEKGADDPATLYRGALRMLQAGDVAGAEKLLDRVVGRAEARPEDAAVLLAARKRLYAVRLEAGRAMLEGRAFGGAAEAFEKAREAAPDASSRAEASLLLGRALVAGGDFRRGIGEFQGLLKEGREEVVDGARLSDLARQEIDQALKSAGGREAYAPFEEEARAALERARRAKTAEAFLEVHRSWPNSRAAEEALLGAAAAQAAQGRADGEIGTLRQFLREYGNSSRAPEACALLVRALERTGQREGVAALLRRMMADFPEAEVEDEGTTRVKARDFVEKRLRNEVPARPAAAPRAAFSPPLRKVFEHVDREGIAGVALEAGGTPPPGISDLLLMNTGITIKALDLRNGAEVWRHVAPSGVQFASFLEDSLVLAGEGSVTRLNPRDGRVEWSLSSATPMRGFLLTGGILCYMGMRPGAVPMPAISAIDAGKGTPAWSQLFQGTRKVSSDGAMLRAAGEGGVAFITLDPYQIHLYDRETGRRLLAKASFTPDPSAELEYASESLAVVSARGRFVEAFALSTGALKWRSGMSSIAVRDLKVASGKVVIAGVAEFQGAVPPEMTLMVLDLENGKILRVKNKIDLGDVRFMLVEGEAAYFVSQERDRTVAVRSVSLGDLSVRWKTGLGVRDATAFPPVLAKDHLAVMTFGSGGTGKYFYDGSLLDREGRVVQNIRGEPVFDRPPHAAVANDRIVFSVDNRVEVYR